MSVGTGLKGSNDHEDHMVREKTFGRDPLEFTRSVAQERERLHSGSTAEVCSAVSEVRADLCVGGLRRAEREEDDRRESD